MHETEYSNTDFIYRLGRRVDELERITSQGPVTLTQQEYSALKKRVQEAEVKFKHANDYISNLSKRCDQLTDERDTLLAICGARRKSSTFRATPADDDTKAKSDDTLIGKMVRRMEAGSILMRDKFWWSYWQVGRELEKVQAHNPTEVLTMAGLGHE